jgi:hypothetical protein
VLRLRQLGHGLHHHRGVVGPELHDSSGLAHP